MKSTSATEFTDDYMRNNKSQSAATRRTMAQNLKRVEVLLAKPFERVRPADFKGDDFMAKLKETYSVNTAISTVVAVIRFLDQKPGYQKRYQDELNALVNERNTKQTLQQKTVSEKKNWVDYPELVAVVTEHAEQRAPTDPIQLRNFALMCAFTLMPPARIGNFAGMIHKKRADIKRQLKSLPSKFNYIVSDAGKHTFVFNKYKTAKFLGQIITEVDNPTLNKVLEQHLRQPGSKYFIATKDGAALPQSRLTGALKSISKKVVGKELSCNMFRHIFITDFLSRNPPLTEKIRVLRLCGQRYQPNSADLYERNSGIEDAAVEGVSNLDVILASSDDEP